MSNFGTAIKKPIPINWFKWDGDYRKLEKWVEGFSQNMNDHFFIAGNTSELKINTLEGTSYDVPEGYIIMRGIQGEYYPCDPKIFEESYDILKDTIN